ncbi:DUF819 family protein [Tissierella praeacuta]|uniref:DUF819 family protein n=1 Tax=Tissierella praeacuta TaxID=43131 RepID=UPI003340977F
MITNGFTYIAFLVFFAAILVGIKKITNWKIFDYVPPIVMVYLFNMLFCTFNLWDISATSAAYSAVKNNMLYGMIFVMLLRCDVRRMVKLGPRILTIFFSCALTIVLGFIVTFIIFKGALGAESWRAFGALCASWIGGSGNMAAMQLAFEVPEGDYACALIVDTIFYSVWIAVLLIAVPYAERWNKFCKANISSLEKVSVMSSDDESEKHKVDGASLTILLGLSFMVSALSQNAGGWLNEITGISASTWTVLIVTFVGLIAALSPLGKIGGAEELSTMYLYVVISLLASRAGLNDLMSAPLWLLAGLVVLIVHIVLMVIISKAFHFDLCMVSTASLANIGGAASAPIVAAAYDGSYAGIGVLMGVLGAAAGNILGLLCGYIMKLLA